MLMMLLTASTTAASSTTEAATTTSSGVTTTGQSHTDRPSHIIYLDDYDVEQGSDRRLSRLLVPQHGTVFLQISDRGNRLTVLKVN